MNGPGSRDAIDEQATTIIVDDAPRVLDSLEVVLAADFRVLRAGGSPAVLEILRAEDDVAVIVIDYKMPGMTGVELLRKSQAIVPDAIRVVLTAYSDVDSLRGTSIISWPNRGFQ